MHIGQKLSYLSPLCPSQGICVSVSPKGSLREDQNNLFFRINCLNYAWLAAHISKDNAATAAELYHQQCFSTAEVRGTKIIIQYINIWQFIRN